MDKKKKLNSVAKKWVKALRSGKYRQAMGTLHNKDNKFCCLGVLCDLAVKAKVIPAPDATYINGDRYYDGNVSTLPNSVMNWAGLADDEGAFTTKDGKRERLTNLNDTGKKFSTIARVIESRQKDCSRESKRRRRETGILCPSGAIEALFPEPARCRGWGRVQRPAAPHPGTDQVRRSHDAMQSKAMRVTRCLTILSKSSD